VFFIIKKTDLASSKTFNTGAVDVLGEKKSPL